MILISILVKAELAETSKNVTHNDQQVIRIATISGAKQDFSVK